MELEGKIINFLGDSITFGAGVEDIENCRYDNVIKREYSLKKVNNYGIGGTRIAYQTKPSRYPQHDLYFCARAYLMSPEADIIVVYGGVNDYIHGSAPIGKIGDSAPSTFCGAVDFLMTNLKELYKGAQIVFLTPARCCYDGSVYTHPSTNENKQSDAQNLRYYCDVIIQTAEKHGIPVLDLYKNMPVDPLIKEDSEKYTIDGLHFNDAGHAILAKLVAEFLLSI